MKRTWVKRAVLIAVLLLLISSIIYYKIWSDRYVWPADLQEMQDLPPIDRSGWPESPSVLRQETLEIMVATPSGTKLASITYHVNSIGMDLVRIKPGSFNSRSTGIHDQSLAKHRNPKSAGNQITITRPFFLGAFEVTNQQFELFDPSRAERRPDYQQGEEGDSHPAEPISWNQAERFARWLSRREGRLYRLPTEAEWEYAARAGTTTRVHWGNAFWDRTKANLGGLRTLHEVSKFDQFEFTGPVGTYPANPWGLYDMIGNSWEWARDWWAPYAKMSGVDPSGPARGHLRVYKGGNWTTRPYKISVAARDGDDPADIPDIRGFRVLAEIIE